MTVLTSQIRAEKARTWDNYLKARGQASQALHQGRYDANAEDLARVVSVVRDLDARIARLEEVADRWDVPGGSKALARRAQDKADGLRVARRLLAGMEVYQ